jgi:hypothetical protein
VIEVVTIYSDDDWDTGDSGEDTLAEMTPVTIAPVDDRSFSRAADKRFTWEETRLPRVRRAMVNGPQYRAVYPLPSREELLKLGIDSTLLFENQIHRQLVALRIALREADREDAALAAQLDTHLMHWENLQDRETPTDYVQAEMSYQEMFPEHAESYRE